MSPTQPYGPAGVYKYMKNLVKASLFFNKKAMLSLHNLYFSENLSQNTIEVHQFQVPIIQCTD